VILGRIKSLFGSSHPQPVARSAPGASAAVATDEVAADSNDVALRAAIVELTGFEPIDLSLYDTAFKHRSILRRRTDTRIVSNERLEFLGDAVLGFVVADYLFRRFRGENEGFLTRLRAKLVNGHALAHAAREIGLGAHVQMSDNMVQKDGRDNASILSDALEALMGAIYLDLGMNPARDFIHRLMLDDVNLSKLAQHRDNFKSLLLEHVQSTGDEQPRYELVSEQGPGHSRSFTVDVFVGDRNLGRGNAGNKKSAEQRAARHALERLQDPEETTHREIQ
jgi:ribonuclease-3